MGTKGVHKMDTQGVCSRPCTCTSCIPHYKKTPGCALVLVPAGLLGTGTGTRSTVYNKSIRGTCTPYVHPNAGDSYKRYKKGMRLTGYFMSKKMYNG